MTTQIKKLGLVPSFAIYIFAALLMYVQTRHTIPYLSKVTGMETVLFWFIVAGAGIFTPLILTGIAILRYEGYKINRDTINQRLRFHTLKKRDFLLTLIGFIVVGLISYIVMEFLIAIVGEFNPSPSFMTFEPLSSGRYWLLIVWFPYWILNILGEEFLWRGVMFPRQELAFGKYTWIIHGLGWGLFHVAFGWKLLLTLTPLLFIQSFVVQKTKNSWTGVIMHAGLNGPSFIAISLGFI